MNERIFEMAIKCGIIVMDQHGEDNSDAVQEFAELIVRECLEIVNRKEYSYHEADPLWETAQLIKEHFGVK